MGKAKVDKDKCIGCGACEALCPEVFKIKDGKSHVIGEGNCDLDAAVNSCPVQAISYK